MRYDKWAMDLRPGGWVRAANETGVVAFFRLIPDELHRLRVRVALLDSPGAITTHTWREAPFVQAEMIAMAPPAAEILTRPAETDAGSVEPLQRYFDETADAYPDRGMAPTDLLIPDEGEPSESFHTIRPPAGHLTDEFLDDVAGAYRFAIARGAAPAPAIAEMSGAPVRTVHRWILTARKRGFLPPGIQGRAG